MSDRFYFIYELMNSKLKFTIQATKWKARAGLIELNWKKVKTPVFMPVWTKATIKWIILDMLKDPKYIGNLPEINLILANTYHLYLRPWDELIKEFGWLHKFENWNWLILTDSWGFQVFSLWLSKSWKRLFKLTEDWVKFRSIHDWTSHFFSPTWCVDIQCNLWSDIMMMLDVCSPPWISEKKFRQHLFLTHKRAKLQYEHHQKKYDKVNWVLFPIVQWGTSLELRKQSAEYLSSFAYDWIAIGWVSVGESQKDIKKVVEFTTNHLPFDKPRYLMWVWDVEMIKFAIYQWVDMFDCVLPTRLWRHWMYYTDQWYQKISHSKNKKDFSKLTDNCDCFVCRNFSKAYLHHLWKEKEMLWATLLSLHNIVYLHRLVNNIREEILK